MAKSHVLASLTLALVLGGCTGTTTTPLPVFTPSPIGSPDGNPTPTSSPAANSPSPTAAESARPTASEPQSSAEPTAATASAWIERSDVTGGPSAREDHTWTVNDDGSSAYLFGGRGAAGAVLADLWQFDLATDTWTELVPAGDSPAGRFGHTATWVPNVGLVVWSGQGARFFDDIWRYDPAANEWQQLPSSGAVPPARYGSCASLGTDGEMWISHGFTADDGRFADTISYNFSTGTWTDRTPASGDLPVARCLHDCYWSSPDRLVLFGGQTTGVQALGDLWIYDRMTQTWTEPIGQHATPRNLYALATSGTAQEKSAILFGGGSEDGDFLGDTWLLVSYGQTHVPLPMPTGPSARSSATAIADDFSRILLFGGMNETGVLDDLWQLSLPT